MGLIELHEPFKILFSVLPAEGEVRETERVEGVGGPLSAMKMGRGGYFPPERASGG